jgi:hypothetical protein
MRGKTRTRKARIDIMRSDARNVAKKARAAAYNKRHYDGSKKEEDD